MKWYEFDIGWMYIRLLEWLRLAKARPLPAPPGIRYRHAKVDAATLRAVLANRARVMAALNARLRPVWRRELRGLALGAGLDRKAALRLLSRDPGYLNGDDRAGWAGCWRPAITCAGCRRCASSWRSYGSVRWRARSS